MALHQGSPVSELYGVGKTRAMQLEKLGIRTLKDLIYCFPRAYERRGAIRRLVEFDVNTSCAFLLTVATEVRTSKLRGGLTVSKFRAFDESGSVEVVFFNSTYVKDVFHVGGVFRFWVKPAWNKTHLQLVNPKFEPYVEGVPLPDYVPVYPQTEGLSSKQLDKLVRSALSEALTSISDPLPDEVRLSLGLPTLTVALRGAHLPDNDESLGKALRRLAFDEMLYFGLGISKSASVKSRGEGVRFSPCSLKPILDLLPYELTDSQKNAVNDIYRDTVIGEGGKISPMSRIVVGDVGCGKTICALLAIYIAVKSGYQTALMVPTEILARQHYADACELLGGAGIKVELLLGSTPQKEKRRIYEEIENGAAKVVIGTHALITDKVKFGNLGLIVTDEQHRFGVAQRAVLKERAQRAHLLVMSATPIPRTLALAMYGDLDVSRITDMPKGRQRVDTYVVDEGYRTRLNDFIKKQVALGGQCYIVCPSIEGDGDEVVTDGLGNLVSANALGLKNATEYAEQLRRELPSLKIDLLHGRMKAAEKDAVMEHFSSGETKILVSTTVIEVGVNVPNASLMIVENADRFGLSQLHQLRGRVGRGKRKSYCILVSDSSAERSRERLEVMRSTYDGFEIAERDLAMRGPGDFFSSNKGNNLRQSGGFDFKFAEICNDSELATSAFETAKSIISRDPELSLPEHSGLRAELEGMLCAGTATVS